MSPSSKVTETLVAWLRGGSGPLVATIFQKALCVVFAIAFASLGVQLHVLIGARGLLPIHDALSQIGTTGAGYLQFPTLLWWGASDRALTMWWVFGVVVSLAALAGRYPRVLLAIALVDYLSLSVACRTFCHFQWDLLLMETGFLALVLPTDRAAPLAHSLFRVLAFKLYFESGLAKWQSNLHDWHDGSAMRFYYETAPLPGPLAWTAHHLPGWWHTLESRSTLALELFVPFLFFGPRRARLFAAASLTVFQLANLATANYGFFVYLALCLHLFLLDDADVARVLSSVGLPVSDRDTMDVEPIAAWRRALLPLFASAYVTLSLLDGSAQFVAPAGPVTTWLARFYAPFRIINTYHLFGSITRERVEVAFETFDGEKWSPEYLRYKPGDPSRDLPLVAPHQPRVDFQLWFYGLAYRGPAPTYVVNLVDRLCHSPADVAELFRARPPDSPAAVRVSFARYTMTSEEERRATGALWHVEPLGALRSVRCKP